MSFRQQADFDNDMITAVCKGHRYSLAGCLEKGGDPNARGPGNNTLLGLTSFSGCAVQLVENRADPTLTNRNNIGILERQIMNGNYDVVKITARYLQSNYPAVLSDEFKERMRDRAEIACREGRYLAEETLDFITTEFLGRGPHIIHRASLLAAHP